MNFTLGTGVSALAVFIQGFLSFFSPCILPLLPLYIGYLSGGAASTDENGQIHYKQRRILIHTVCFVLGISVTFFLLGLAFTTAGQFFKDYQTWFSRIGGILIILFGLYQLGLFKSQKLSEEHRLPFNADKLAMNPFTAFIFGFTFSFAWTPCVGPVLTSVLIMASSAETQTTGFAYILIYTLGFILPFIATGLFTGALLDLFKKHNSIVRYTVKIGAVIMIILGLLMVTGQMNRLTAGLGGNQTEITGNGPKEPSQGGGASGESESSQSDSQESKAQRPETEKETQAPLTPAPDFTLTDQFGNTHKLSDYKGKTIFLNFWATWCPPCRAEMPEIQELYTDNGENSGDVIILGVASPNYGREGSVSDISDFLTENGYSYPVLMDEGGNLSNTFSISAYPTTFMITANGDVFGYVSGQLSKDMMESIIQQTVDGTK